MRRTMFVLAVGALLGFSMATAQDAMMAGHQAQVTITNTTEGQTFAAPIVLAHDGSYQPFEVGQPALSELVPLAEDGNPSDVETVAKILPSVLAYAIAPGPLAPGESVTLTVDVDADHPLLSVFAMLVTSNDAVVSFGTNVSAAVGDAMGGDAMADDSMSGDSMSGDATSGDTMADDSMSGDAMSGDSMRGDAMSGDSMRGDAMMMDHVDLYDGTVRVLDAGSEANTESCTDVPGPPCGSVGVRHTAMAEGVVTIHPGLQGGGDLDPAVYGWHDPVATVSVEVH